MSRGQDHFRVRDLIVALTAHGRHADVARLNDLEAQIRSLNTQRRDLANALLKDVISAYQDGGTQFQFRPCHARRFHDLEISTEFWLV